MGKVSLKPKSSVKSKYQLYLDNLNDLIFIIKIKDNGDYVFETINKSYSRITKLKSEKIIGKPFKDIFPADTYIWIDTLYKKLIKSKKPIIYEEEWLHYPKEKMIVETSLTPLITGKKVTHILGSSRDITARKRKEEELKNLEASYKDLFDSVTDAIYVLNKDGIFIDVNEGALNMYGYDKDEIIGKSPEFTAAPGKNDMEKSTKDLMRAFMGETVKMTFWGKRKNGEIFPKEIILNKGMYKNEEVVIAAARDVTEQYKNEVKMLSFTKELQQINKAKDKFFSIIAHDLRSPFNGLLGFSKVLNEEFEDLSKAELKEFIGFIHDSAKNVYTLVENLLQWSRLQNSKIEFQPVKLDLNEEVFKIINLLISQAIDKKITLINLIPVNTFINADQNMINSVIQNLLSNAIKFSIPGGKVLLKFESDDEYHYIIVSDNGVGISEKNMKKLFNMEEQFTTTGTSDESGTGLGLLICYELLNANQGTIEVKSEEGKGSDFIIKLKI